MENIEVSEPAVAAALQRFRRLPRLPRSITCCSVAMQYDPDARLIVVDVKKPKGDRVNDLSNMAYYMEKDVRESQATVMEAVALT